MAIPSLLAMPLLAPSLPYVSLGSLIAILVSTHICLWAGIVPSFKPYMSCPAAILEPYVRIIAFCCSPFILSWFVVLCFPAMRLT